MVELTDDAILAILDHIECRAVLRTLLLVSRRFHTAVEPRLYSSIEFNASGPITLRHRLDGLRRRIVSNQYLASSVRKLHVTALNSSLFTLEEFFHLDDMLRYLDGLKDFKLRLRSPPGAILATLVKAPCPFALTKFSWMNRTVDAGEFLYLENQPSIEHLHIATLAVIGTINLVPGTLPRLKELVVPTPIAMAILPGRKVTCLTINVYSPFPNQTSLAMEEALGHIEFLNCTTHKTAFILPGICSMRKLRWFQLSLPLGARPPFAYLRDRTAASTFANFRSSATQPIISIFSFVMVMKPSGRPTPLSHFPGQATDEPASNHRWSEVIPPDTGLTFAVIWDPEDGLLAFSGAELLGSSANYFPDSRPISPSEALDGQSQVITLKTLSSGNVLSETPATLAFFRDTHRFLFAGSRSRLSSAKRPRHGARTQTSSTIGGMDVYLRGSLLGRAHKDQTHYSCFDLLEQEFEVKPFNDLTKTDSTESLEMRYNRAFSIFQAQHNLVTTLALQYEIALTRSTFQSSRFSTTTTSTSSYISVKRNVGDEDFASKTWSILERPSTPIFSRPTLAHKECPNADCGGVCVRASQRLRKYRRKRVDEVDIPTPPAEVLQRSEYNHEVNFPTPDCQRVTTPITLLRGLSNRWKKGHTCTY
ncbi:hypothetical protein CCMSSC00406_0000807 [Pleurotus cornucopiae]|uniref:Uncharacterized protein n=1 Tax=Pleurotus cornucopiae TaxID=5321 RepID=A0ACB7JAC1_PLECO|nr:hypothetical protein CCMSSC00406_0000807 [Pleurotus cornucopiae]